MKSERRWLKTVIAEAQVCKARMPWERGLRRQALISRREAQAAQPQVLRRTA